VLEFIGPVDDSDILNTILYGSTNRIATSLRSGMSSYGRRGLLHLISRRWGRLGLHTGILFLDNDQLVGLSLVVRGLGGEGLLDVYAREQQIRRGMGSGEMGLEPAAQYILAGAQLSNQGDVWRCLGACPLPGPSGRSASTVEQSVRLATVNGKHRATPLPSVIACPILNCTGRTASRPAASFYRRHVPRFVFH